MCYTVAVGGGIVNAQVINMCEEKAMKCTICGTENSDMVSFCKNCGQPLMGDAGAAATEAPVYSGTVEQSGYRMSRAEMLQQPEFDKANKDMKAWIIYLYVVAAITLVASLIGGFPPIDAAIVFILAVVFHKTKSFGAAVALLIFGILELVVSLAVTHKPSGILFIVGAGLLCSITNKIDKAYRYYLQTGIISFN